MRPLTISLSLAVLAGLFASTPASFGQRLEDRLRYLVGQLHPDGAGRGEARAYLIWQAQDPEILRGRQFTVFSKPGATDSNAPYQEVGVMKLLTRAPEIETALTEHPGIVGDRNSLEGAIDDLFEGLLPAANLGLATKLSALTLAAQSHPEVYAQLQVLSRVQPGVALCLGTAAALPVQREEPTTYEVRELPGPGVVSGRVTLDPGAVLVLPAPGPPVEVPRTNIEGHLNARFRWGAGEDLRRVAIHQYGFNLYRVQRATAEQLRFHSTPPPAGELAGLATSNPAVTRVNVLPILPPELLSPAEAADLIGDPDTFFLHDDNRRFVDSVPFQDGDQFWYFVTARDLLGRDGETSPGALVTLFDRERPKAPRRVVVENQFARDPATGEETHRLAVTWRPAPGPAPAGYRVYRWSSVPEIHQNAHGDPEVLAISPLVPHRAGQAVFRYVDDGSGSPIPPADLGNTFWYTVRAYKEAAAGRIYSPNSASGFGVLRDREGPPKATGAGITIRGLCPTVDHQSSTLVPLTTDPGIRADQRWAHVQCNRLDPRIATVQFISLDPAAAGATGGPLTQLPPGTGASPNHPDPAGWVISPLIEFASANQVQHSLAVAATGGRMICLVGTSDGRRALASATLHPDPAANRAHLILFTATVQDKITTITGGEIPPFPHDPIESPSGDLSPVLIGFTTPQTAAEWKIYRRIDHGEQTLFAFGDSTGAVTVEDLDLPLNGALVCYYAQTFDVHGNPSVMQRLGCARICRRTTLPVPLLSARREGDVNDPRVKLDWFCEPHGIEGFQILVGVEVDADVIALDSDQWEPLRHVKETIEDRLYFGYQTGELGGSFSGLEDGRFQLTIDVTPGHQFWFAVRAVSPEAKLGELGNIVPFLWEPAPRPDPEVPWPDRPLPPLHPFADDGPLSVEYIDAPNRGFSGAAVRIGGLRLADGSSGFSLGEMTTDSNGQGQRIPTTFGGALSPDDYLYDLSGGEGRSVLPCVLYRIQIPNELFPGVSGKVVQVTPLIERVRYTTGVPPQGGGVRTSLHDPFIEAFRPPAASHPDELGIYLKDSQGVVTGASYSYTLVRFKENGEIDRSIEVGSIHIGNP